MANILFYLVDYYGANIDFADPAPILWAADKAADEIGVEAAKKALSEINRYRERTGRLVAVFDYGHRMF